MNPALLVLALAVFSAGEDVPSRGAGTREKEKPKHSPYAPSLPYLTKEEEEKLDDVIDRFMLYDIGRLQGQEAAKALKDFKNLGLEAIPALVRGVNRAAKIQHSCPVVVIAQKLNRLLAGSDDRELMEFVKDEIGSGVGPTRHASVLQDLRMAVTIRKNALARRGSSSSSSKLPRTMTVVELADAASTERGPRLKMILAELEKRRGREVAPALANAAASYEKDIQKLGRHLLDRHLARQTDAIIQEKLRDDLIEVRTAAIRVIGGKKPRLGGELIELLSDDQDEVRAAAHEALVKLSRGQDFGPIVSANKEQIAEARAKWRNWWDSRKSKR